MSYSYNTNFATADAALKDAAAQLKAGTLSQEAYDDTVANILGAKYEKGFDQEQFDTLLNKLTGSKIRQGRAAGIEQRKGTYTSGLANMMRNF
jgi:hypothetical protein